jgi:hypothetical protein
MLAYLLRSRDTLVKLSNMDVTGLYNRTAMSATNSAL